MPPITCVEDLRVLAKKKLPRSLYECIDSGAFDQVTKFSNESDFLKIRLRQRVLANVAGRSLDTTILGQPVALPVAISPTGFSGVLTADGNGEIAAARAAAAANIPFGLSMLSFAPMEDIHAATNRPFWLHLMIMKDKSVMRFLLERAKNANCSAIIATVDYQLHSKVRANIRNGLSAEMRPKLRDMWQYVTRPRWSLKALMPKRPFQPGNFTGKYAIDTGGVPVGEWWVTQLDDAASWNDLKWIRENWKGKLIVKGILDPEDARRAIDAGADAISVSNHGGLQLDGAPSSISTLPIIVDAVGGRTEIFMDGGVRSGQDVIKALALGAKACLLGRAHLFGLAAGGEKGVGTMLSIIREELDITLGLTGLRSINDVSSDILWPHPPSPATWK